VLGKTTGRPRAKYDNSSGPRHRKLAHALAATVQDVQSTPALAYVRCFTHRETNQQTGNVRGALWLLLSSLMFALMSTTVHELGQRLPSVEIVFFRTVFLLMLLIPIVVRRGILGMATSRWRLHLFRGLIGAMAIQCGFYAIANMPIADATAITFSRALFITILAMIFLGEKVGIHRWAATIIGFVGILIMLKPGTHGISIAAGAALAGAALVACLSILVRILSSTERNEQIMVFSAVINIFVSAPLTWYFWVKPSATDLAILVLAAVTGFAAQWSMIEGFRVGEASALAPINYTRLIFALIIGFVIFGEVPGFDMLLGSVIVVAATLYTLHRESVVKKTK